MNVHFIDTSVFTNILDIPYMNKEKESVIKEFKCLLNTKDIDKLILPFATIIETGNHIAHNGNGSQRRTAAEQFRKVMEKTIEGIAPWSYYGNQLTKEDIHMICIKFPDAAMRGEGFGDLSIIQAYLRYKADTPAIHRIRIWTLDKHMKEIYDEVVTPPQNRNER